MSKSIDAAWRDSEFGDTVLHKDGYIIRDTVMDAFQKAGQIAGMSIKILSLKLSNVDRISHALGRQSPYFEKGD